MRRTQPLASTSSQWRWFYRSSLAMQVVGGRGNLLISGALASGRDWDGLYVLGVSMPVRVACLLYHGLLLSAGTAFSPPPPPF